MIDGGSVQAVWIAGAEIERGWFLPAAKGSMQAAHERGFAHAGAALEDDPAFQLRFGHQVIKTGDKAVRPHGAGEKRAHCAQKYPSQKRLAKAVASAYGGKGLLMQRDDVGFSAEHDAKGLHRAGGTDFYGIADNMKKTDAIASVFKNQIQFFLPGL